MTSSSATTRPRREMKVLSLGLPRTGSASICKALTILGYQGVYHTLNALDCPRDWEILSRAADATFPSLPTYTGKAFSLEDWEELYGPYEASTDVAASFGPQLVKVYPRAKVLLVTRDYDRWYRSVDEGIFRTMWTLPADIVANCVEPLLGCKLSEAGRKIALGFFEARSVDEARGNARRVFDRHYRQIREMVPPEQLLVYRMGDGWGPLCEFLGKPVPEAEFPWVNEAAEFKAIVAREMRLRVLEASRMLMPWIVGIGAIGAGSWWIMNKTGMS